MKIEKKHILLFVKSKLHELLLTKEIQSCLNQCSVTSIQSKKEALNLLETEDINSLVIDVESGNQIDVCNVHQIHLHKPNIPIVAVVNNNLKEFSDELFEIGVTKVIKKNDSFYIEVSEFLKSILPKELIKDEVYSNEPELDQSEHLKSTARILSHEINNPLMTILGIAELILDDPFEYDQNLIQKIKTIQKSALRIQKSTYRMTHITSPVYQKTPYGVMIDPKKSRIYTKSKVKLSETE